MECAGRASRAQQRPEHYTHSGRIFPVAQTSSLLYRGFPIRKRWEVRRPCRLEVGDTAGWKPALLLLCEMCEKCSDSSRFMVVRFQVKTLSANATAESICLAREKLERPSAKLFRSGKLWADLSKGTLRVGFLDVWAGWGGFFLRPHLDHPPSFSNLVQKDHNHALQFALFVAQEPEKQT